MWLLDLCSNKWCWLAFSRYFNLRASSIAGGTNEVQKNIVAKLVLGL